LLRYFLIFRLAVRNIILMKRIIGVFLLFSLTATTFAQTEVQYNKLTIEERAKYDARIDNEIKSSGDEVQTSVIE